MRFHFCPDELARMVQTLASTAKSLGHVGYDAKPSEPTVLSFGGHCMWSVTSGGRRTFTRENLRSIRPGYGLAPKYLQDILGKKVLSSIPAGH